jgi:predicted porin
MEVIMNKTLLALAVTAAAIGTQANALEVFNDGTTTASIGGHATVGVIAGKAGGNAQVEEKSPRINLEVKTDLGNGFTADVKGEWATNFLKGGETSFKTRLGYIGVSHEDFGRLSAGTQWSPYYMAAGVVDQPIAFSNDFLYDNQGILGTARGDAMVAYTNAFDFDTAGAFNFGLAWQGQKSTSETYTNAGEAGFTDGITSDTYTGTRLESENRGQVALGYTIEGFNFNYAYSGGNITERGVAKKATSNLISGKFGNYGAGLYVAATVGFNKNMNNADTYEGAFHDASAEKKTPLRSELLAETRVFDSILAYGFDNGLNIIAKHEEMKDEKEGSMVKSGTSIQAEYTISPRMRAYTGFNYDNQGEGKYKKAKDHTFVIGTRFYL